MLMPLVLVYYPLPQEFPRTTSPATRIFFIPVFMCFSFSLSNDALRSHAYSFIQLRPLALLASQCLSVHRHRQQPLTAQARRDRQPQHHPQVLRIAWDRLRALVAMRRGDVAGGAVVTRSRVVENAASAGCVAAEVSLQLELVVGRRCRIHDYRCPTTVSRYAHREVFRDRPGTLHHDR